MSRLYWLHCEVVYKTRPEPGIEKQLSQMLGIEQSLFDENQATFTGHFCLAAGQFEREAHDDLVERIRAILPVSTVTTKWKYQDYSEWDDEFTTEGEESEAGGNKP